ncbi:hypothetical protein MHYP_G00287750 [Metynnis hypsauchen]
MSVLSSNQHTAADQLNITRYFSHPFSCIVNALWNCGLPMSMNCQPIRVREERLDHQSERRIANKLRPYRPIPARGGRDFSEDGWETNNQLTLSVSGNTSVVSL